MPTPPEQKRQSLLQILDAALRAVDAKEAVRAHISCSGQLLQIGPKAYHLDEIDRVFVVGAGKAGAPMGAALVEVLGTRITAGLVIVKQGYAAPAGHWWLCLGTGGSDSGRRIEGGSEIGPIGIIEAGHPVPDEAGQAGAARMADMLRDLTPRDLVIVLISGGGSALLPLPVEGVTLDEYRVLNGLLLGCGADIREINAVRKHSSQLQGGGLARLAAPARLATLILSDVVGSPLDVIASGPTVPDRSTFTDALAVLERYGMVPEVPVSVLDHLRRGAAGAVPDTPKPGDPLFDEVVNVVIGDNERAGRAAVEEARRQGYHSLLLTTFLQGEAREVGKAIAGLAQGIAWGQSDFKLPACLVLGGETTVAVRGHGIGGRNQELALAAAIALDGYPLPDGADVAVVTLATDGTDGPTAAAGGIVTANTVPRGRALGLDARAALVENDSYRYLGALGDLVITGPTGTNVNDLTLVVCWQKSH